MFHDDSGSNRTAIGLTPQTLGAYSSFDVALRPTVTLSVISPFEKLQEPRSFKAQSRPDTHCFRSAGAAVYPIGWSASSTGQVARCRHNPSQADRGHITKDMMALLNNVASAVGGNPSTPEVSVPREVGDRYGPTAPHDSIQTSDSNF